jgi:pimeloyl-ACP methyl ester carboxylesterase
MTHKLAHHVALVNGFRMHYVRAGNGPVLVLLHGWPQSWYEWRHLIPVLAERYTVIAPDLRGLGDSEKPREGYDKRTLASDVRELLRGLGIARIGLVGHDWGGATAFYLAHDNPALVAKLFIFDMIPGLGRAGGGMDFPTARRFWHVFWHGGKPDLAEKFVRMDVEGYLRHFFTSTDYNYRPDVFSREDIAEYVRCMSAPGAIRAGFQYYQTGIEQDLENLASCTKKLEMPVRAFGGSAFLGNVVPAWQTVAEHVDGGVVPECGHFVPEEKPEFAAQAVLEFFADFGDVR